MSQFVGMFPSGDGVVDHSIFRRSGASIQLKKIKTQRLVVFKYYCLAAFASSENGERPYHPWHEFYFIYLLGSFTFQHLEDFFSVHIFPPLRSLLLGIFSFNSLGSLSVKDQMLCYFSSFSSFFPSSSMLSPQPQLHGFF